MEPANRFRGTTKMAISIFATLALGQTVADQNDQGVVDCLWASLPQAATVKNIELFATGGLCATHELKWRIYMSREGAARLVGSAAALRQTGAPWYLSDAVMRDSKDGSSTIVRIDDVVEGESLLDSYFQPNSIYLGN